jgi:hypothetical protein
VAERGFKGEERSNQELGGDGAENNGRGAAPSHAIGFQIHDFAKQMGVHREHDAEEHGLPWQLRHSIDSAADVKHQQVSGLVQDVHHREVLEAEPRGVVEAGGSS